jgi:glycosyltransferase involved in cell wall biosynthesis
MTATVIIPTTGAYDVKQAIESVLEQTYETQIYVVIDGLRFEDKVDDILNKVRGDFTNVHFCTLPINVGANGFYGHRVYAAFTHLINTDYVLYLDQDCWMRPNHVESLIDTIESNNLDWAYSLRSIWSQDGAFICLDNCESLGPEWPIMGYPHVDTNCYCIKTSVATKVASAWHGGWGQDRVFLNVLSTHFKSYKCSSLYTLNYRMGGDTNAVNANFFVENNMKVEKHYNGELPWRKT